MTTYQPAPDTRERFLQGKLSESETSQFELWLADHPDELEILELDLLMQEGLKSQRKHLDADPAQPLLTMKHWLMATPVMLLVVIGSWLLLNQTTPEVHTIELLKTRGAPATEVTMQAPPHALIELKIYPDEANRSYQLVVSGTNSHQSKTFTNLSAAAYQAITVHVDPEKINDNKWEVQLIDDTGFVEQLYLVLIGDE
jgi:hypothetical protein